MIAEENTNLDLKPYSSLRFNQVINKNNVAYVFLFFAALFWSGNFLVGKFASQYQVPPFSLNFYSYTHDKYDK